MKRSILAITLLSLGIFLWLPRSSPQLSVAATPAVAQPAQPVQPPAQPQPQQKPKPSMALNLGTKFLFEILNGLCITNYQIYLGDEQSFIIFRELKHLQNIPFEKEVELCMVLDFSIKKFGVRYQDQAEATLRLKFNPQKKGDKIMLQGFGRALTIRTKFGPTLDENLLLPQINKQITKGPLFEVPLSDIAHVLVPWPKLGDSPRITELNLTDATIEIQQTSVIFNLTIAPQTMKPE